MLLSHEYSRSARPSILAQEAAESLQSHRLHARQLTTNVRSSVIRDARGAFTNIQVDRKGTERVGASFSNALSLHSHFAATQPTKLHKASGSDSRERPQKSAAARGRPVTAPEVLDARRATLAESRLTQAPTQNHGHGHLQHDRRRRSGQGASSQAQDLLQGPRCSGGTGTTLVELDVELTVE